MVKTRKRNMWKRNFAELGGLQFLASASFYKCPLPSAYSIAKAVLNERKGNVRTHFFVLLLFSRRLSTLFQQLLVALPWCLFGS